MQPAPLRTAVLTLLAMLAFAGNSLLCRAAIGQHLLDEASFTLVRFGSGAVTLAIIASVQGDAKLLLKQGSWRSTIILLFYAYSFSFAYLSLDTGTGALLLFGTVQITMISYGIFKGERPSALQWLGFLSAMGGFLYLLRPGLSAPPLLGSLLMTVAGIGWGLYSLFGRGESRPLLANAGNFIRAILPMLLLQMIFWDRMHAELNGLLLGFLSGSLTSGIGYALWYSALRGHSASSGSIVQLSVPIFAALAGILLLDEVLTERLIVASTLVLGGILLAMLTGRKALPRNQGAGIMPVLD